MHGDTHADGLEKDRAEVAKKVRELRRERHWTQAELSRRLDLSQGRLSEVERGAGSFTAEQFLAILKLFNVPVSHFSGAAPDQASELQNALARLGAVHLQESADVLPSERLTEVRDVVREALVAAEFPRSITALAPVLVRNVDRLRLKRLELQLADAGLERRLAWLVDNTLEVIGDELHLAPRGPWRQLCRRAEVVLGTFLDGVNAERASRPSVPALDILDADIRSKQTLEEVVASSSPISRRWGIVTSLQPRDFAEALRAARVA